VPGSLDRFVVSRPARFVHVERRADDRVPVRVDAELVVGVGGGETETIRATTVDLSSKGAAVLSPQALRPGRRLLVLLHLDEGGPVLAGAVVAVERGTSRGGARLGLDLQLIDPRDRERLAAHLATVRS
jgi:c-di-GMP-binding flagellar brake protein YcgR